MEKEFLLDNPIDVPIKLNFHKIDDGYLCIAREKPNWLSLNDLEKKVLTELNKGIILRDSLLSLMNLNEQEIISIAKSLLEKIDKNEFYENAVNIIEDGDLAMHYYITNMCNLECIHCYRDAGKFKDKNELTTQEIKNLFDDFSKLSKGPVSFSGGEPLKRSDFFEIAEYIKNLGNSLSLYTNGILITGQNSKKISEFFDAVQISLDGATPKINDEIRGEGSFNKIIRGINYLENSIIPITISMVVNPINEEDIRLNLRYLLKERIRNSNVSIKIGGLVSYGRGKCIEKGDSIELIEKIINDSGIKSFKKTDVPRNIKNTGCGYGKAMVLNYNGDIFSCSITQEEARIGNIKSMGMDEIFEKLEQASESTSVHNFKECKECDLEYICGGGCRIKNKKQTGDFTKPHCDEKYKERIYKQLYGILS